MKYKLKDLRTFFFYIRDESWKAHSFKEIEPYIEPKKILRNESNKVDNKEFK